MKDFLTFRKMLTPMLIQLIFWLLFIFLIIVGIVDIVHNAPLRIIFQVIIIGPLAARMVCELLMLLFRMNDNLTEINQQLKQLSPGNIPKIQ